MNGNEPAFPEPFLSHPNLALATKPGLSKREYFAAMAMQGLLSNPEYMRELDVSYKIKVITDKNVMLAREAVDMSDELLKQLELVKPQQP